MKRSLIALTSVLSLAACGGEKSPSDNELALKGVGAIVVLQRTARMSGLGDVFQYSSYAPGAKLTKLEPPTADGVRTNVCCDAYPEMAGLDIQAFDVSFDARSIVFSGRIEGDSHYGLYLLTLNEKGESVAAPRRLPTSPSHDFVYPIFAPHDRIIFVTNESVEPGEPQHQDEYERGTTTQLGRINIDGTNQVLGPSNLSHRVAPTMLADGRVVFTQWDHLQDMNAGHLMMVNTDFTALREVYGKEAAYGINSYLKAVEIEPGVLVAIGTTRDRTIQSGKLLRLGLGKMVDGVFRQSEANSYADDLTPQVPEDGPSANTVGRYYTAYPVKNLDGSYGEKPLLLVSWADGVVEQGVLGEAKLAPDFGVYLYDSKTRSRLPVLNDKDTWDVSPRPLSARAAPAAIDDSAKDGMAGNALLVGSLNVYDSTKATFPPGSVERVRIIEGFSVEEGIPDDFGLTEAEGAAMLGEAKVFSDGSWAATVPANVPIHLQPIDKFGMALLNEPVWFSGRPGESRFCGGCHEDRANTTVIQPGITMAMASGKPQKFDFEGMTHAQRSSTDYSQGKVVGVPWDKALQDIFDRKCTSCHDGTDNGMNTFLTFTDETGTSVQTIFFNLKGDPSNINVGGEMLSGYSASHLTLMGPMMEELEDAGITVTGTMKPQIEPGAAKKSLLFDKLNPMPLYGVDAGSTDVAKRYKPAAPIHPADKGGQALTAQEYYLLILMADAGGQFYSRENKPGLQNVYAPQ